MIVTVVVLPPGTGLTPGPGGMTTTNVSSSSITGSSMMVIFTQARVEPAVKVSWNTAGSLSSTLAARVRWGEGGGRGEGGSGEGEGG